jgi:hypothetical protein
MNVDNLIESICRLPDKFRSEGKSILQIVSESGIEDSPSALTVKNIVPCLVAHPELVDKWLGWSADNRSSPSWYFREARVIGYEVGYYPDGEVLKFVKRERACAEFIIRKVQTYLSHIEKFRKDGRPLTLTLR